MIINKMTMKFNWGTGIFLVYTAFAGVLFYAVYRSTSVNHSLVVDKYYERDLNYQKEYEGKVNSLAMEQKLKVEYLSVQKRVLISVPTNLEGVHGNVLFYRASDKSQDFNLPLNPNEEGLIEVEAEKLMPGRWKIEISWNAGDKAYFDTYQLDIPAAKS